MEESKVTKYPKTLKLVRVLERYLILLLVDSGANHNCMPKEQVSSLGLEVTSQKNMWRALEMATDAYHMSLQEVGGAYEKVYN